MQATAQQRILVISHDVVGSRMAGTGIRSWQLARVLAQTHQVTLIAPQPIDLAPPGVTVGSYRWGDAASMETWLDVDVVVANGFMLLAHQHLARIPQPLALDLYDPVLLENLELFRQRDDAERTRQLAQDQALLQQQLATGDFLMCATERQRDLLIGALMGTGRITHAVTDHDPTLRRLIDVVPFGVASTPPEHTVPALRGVVEGIGADDAVLLWTGGLWDWLDPQTLVEAMPAIVDRHPEARLVFLAGQHPGTIEPMRAPVATRQRAAELGLLDTHIFFYDQWIPYEQRSSFLLEADIAVSLHHTHLETAYAAVRSRFLDHLWAGLPSVVADGDAAADLVRTKALGIVVPAGERAATAAAVVELFDDRARLAQYAANASALAQHYTWDIVARPLVDFCATPQRIRAVTERHEPEPEPTPPPSSYPGVHATMQQEQTRLLKQLEDSWQFGTLAANPRRSERLLHEAILRVVGPLIAQQRDFNATVVQFLYTLQERQDVDVVLNAVMAQLAATAREVSIMQTDLRRQIDDTHARIDDTHARIEDAHARIEDAHARTEDAHTRIDSVAVFTGELSARLDTLERDLHSRLDTTADVLETIRRDANARLDTLANFGGELNDRLTRLAYATQLLDQAVVTGDNVDALLAEQIALLSNRQSDDEASDTTLPAAEGATQ